MSVRDVLRGWWLVVVCLVLAAALIGTYLHGAKSTYRSSGTYVIGPAATLATADNVVRSFESLQALGIVPTLVELFHSRAVALGASSEVGVSQADLAQYQVDAAVLSGSTTLEVTVTGPNAPTAARLAGAIGDAAARRFEHIYPIYAITPLDAPLAATSPLGPHPARYATIALFLGLLVGVGLALLRAKMIATPALAGGVVDHEAQRR
jgi:capsular polysaccharide biosynthesis protein